MTVYKRAVLYDQKKNSEVRFLDWALTTTNLGTFVEPFFANVKFAPGSGSISNYDPTDEMCRIDELMPIDATEEKIRLSFGGHQIHGGNLHPRVGR